MPPWCGQLLSLQKSTSSGGLRHQAPSLARAAGGGVMLTALLHALHY